MPTKQKSNVKIVSMNAGALLVLLENKRVKLIGDHGEDIKLVLADFTEGDQTDVFEASNILGKEAERLLGGDDEDLDDDDLDLDIEDNFVDDDDMD